MANKIEAWFKKKKNRQIAFMILGAVCLYFWIKNQDKGSAGYSDLGARNPTPTPGNPANSFPERVVNAAGAKGIFQQSSPNGERTMYFQATPDFNLDLRNDGLYHVETGLDTSGAINKIGGKNVFYSLNGAPWYNTETNTYNKLQGVEFMDGIGTFKRFLCDPNHTPTQAAFNAQYNGYNNGITQLNSSASQLNFAIWSKTRRGNSIEPSWLKPSRDLISPTALQLKDWAQWGKHFGIGMMNLGDAPSKYQDLGMYPHTDWGKLDTPQPETFCTAKVGKGAVMSNELWYANGNQWAKRLGSTPRAHFSNEFAENADGQDPNTFGKEAHCARGYMDELRSKGHYDVAKTGSCAGYGVFDFTGYFGPDLFTGTRQDREKNLTTHLFKGWGITNDGTGVAKFSQNDHDYYTNGLHENSNVNTKEYPWNRFYLLPYEFIYKNEKVKRGTTQYGGKGWTRSLSVIGTGSVESFVMNNQNQKINIEQSFSGEVIQYPNGKMRTRRNTHPAAPWDLMFDMSVASMLVTSGMVTWEAPGARLGQDANKFYIYDTAEDPNDQPMEWMPNGSNQWQPYVSGQNGAPVNSPDGLNSTLYAAALDATAAGMEAVWTVRDRIQVLKHVAYTSNKGGGFSPTPGQAGHHLNGFGADNLGQFTILDLVDQKKAISIDCSGSGGGFIWFYNGFKAKHEFEEITCKGKSFRAHGRTHYFIPY